MSTRTYHLTEAEFKAIQIAMTMYVYINLDEQAKTNPEAADMINRYRKLKDNLYEQDRRIDDEQPL